MSDYNQRKAQVHANKSVVKVIGKYPQATQDVDENTKNRTFLIQLQKKHSQPVVVTVLPLINRVK